MWLTPTLKLQDGPLYYLAKAGLLRTFSRMYRACRFLPVLCRNLLGTVSLHRPGEFRFILTGWRVGEACGVATQQEACVPGGLACSKAGMA